MATELQGATDELAVLQQLRNELEGSASPRVESVVNAAVARERTLQEARNRKVLELLNSKVGTGWESSRIKSHCESHGLA